MPKETTLSQPQDNARLSLEKAFLVFQQQSQMLEKSHDELKHQLAESQLSLEEKNRELALRVAEIESVKSKLSGTLESITDAVFLLDNSGEVEVSNPAAADFASMTPDGTDGMFTHPVIKDLVMNNVAIKDKIVELTVKRERKYYMISAVPLRETTPNSRRKVVCIKDITEEHILQQKLSREDRMASLGRVAASVAHEIRNPLGAIEGFAMLLERDLKELPDAQRLASKTIYAARQLNSVVGNLLTHTREMEPNTAPVDIRGLISKALDFVIPMAEDHKVKVDIHLSETPVISKLDHIQFSQVITNLAVNAVQACPLGNGGEVAISVDKSNDCAIVEVKDNGEGVPTKRKKRIFEPFFTMKDGGTGLGLSLCQRIIEAHGGEIYECGKPKRGAHFVVKLKLAEEKND